MTQSLTWIYILLGLPLFLRRVNSFMCNSAGKFPNYVNHRLYYECHLVGDNKFSLFEQSCPEKSCFSPITNDCGVCQDVDEESMSSKPNHNFICPAPGKFPHEDPSRKEAFYKCIDIDGKLLMFEYRCLPFKPCFSAAKQSCLVC